MGHALPVSSQWERSSCRSSRAAPQRWPRVRAQRRRSERNSRDLEGSETIAGDYFGNSAAMSGTAAVVGALDPKGAGRAYVFEV